MDRAEPKQVARERAIRLAVKQANQTASLGGRTFALVQCTTEERGDLDDLHGQDAAVAAATFLVDNVGVPAIVGPSSSASTTAVFRALLGTGTLVISPAATGTALTSLEPGDRSDDNPGLLWRTAPSDAFQGLKISQDMLARKVQKAAVLHMQDAYGEGLKKVFVEEFGKGGGSAEIAQWSSGAQLPEAITNVGAMPVKEVLFISSVSTDIVAFLNSAAQDPQYDMKSFFLPDSAASVDVFSK
ncbi:MAG: ABC transporter substrate-binding protein, partial [Polyangiaceae bacterium]|nr:ABC transporter substrate-binding protein [Polyangiaceae bacterium]